MDAEELKEARLNFLNDTVKYYSEDISKRGVTPDGNCAYRYNDKKCAIGRYIPDDKYNENIETFNCGQDIVFNLLSEDIQKLGRDFLIRIQEFHDYDNNWNDWNDERLTYAGVEDIQHIKTLFELEN